MQERLDRSKACDLPVGIWSASLPLTRSKAKEFARENIKILSMSLPEELWTPPLKGRGLGVGERRVSDIFFCCRGMVT